MKEHTRDVANHITNSIEMMLDSSLELLEDQSALNYSAFEQHRRIIKACKEIIYFFE